MYTSTYTKTTTHANRVDSAKASSFTQIIDQVSLQGNAKTVLEKTLPGNATTDVSLKILDGEEAFVYIAANNANGTITIKDSTETTTRCTLDASNKYKIIFVRDADDNIFCSDPRYNIAAFEDSALKFVNGGSNSAVVTIEKLSNL